MKKILSLLVAAILTLGIAGFSFSAEEVKGKITKIQITVKDAKGKEVVAEVKETDRLKVGDNVQIKDEKAKKAAPGY